LIFIKGLGVTRSVDEMQLAGLNYNALWWELSHVPVNCPLYFADFAGMGGAFLGGWVEKTL
jgi:hypothetical protein